MSGFEMNRTVICSHCGKILENGGIGATVVKKLCRQCVVMTHNASPKNQLLMPNLFGPNREQRRSGEVKTEDPQMTFGYKWQDHSLNSTGRRILLVISVALENRENVFQIGLPIDQLQEFLNEMKEYEEKDEEPISGDPA